MLGGQEWRRAQRNKKGCYARKYKDIIGKKNQVEFPQIERREKCLRLTFLDMVVLFYEAKLSKPNYFNYIYESVFE